MYDLETMDPRYVIFATTFLVANRLQQVMDQHIQDISCKQWLVLTVLGTFESAPTLKELSKACDSSHQNTKQIVLKLEEKGYIAITKDEKDGRALRIHKTEQAEQWSQDNKDRAAAFIGQMFHKLSEADIVTMNNAQQLIYKTLGEMEDFK